MRHMGHIVRCGNGCVYVFQTNPVGRLAQWVAERETSMSGKNRFPEGPSPHDAVSSKHCSTGIITQAALHRRQFITDAD